jgi:hypothetical protein
MSKQNFHPRLAVLLILIIAAGAMRIPNSVQILPWSNFSPVGAMALFGGAYFNSKWKAVLFPLLTLLLGDLIVSIVVHKGQYGIIYDGWYWVYGIYLLIVLAGRLLIKKVTVKNIVVASVTAALMHWLLSDLAMWIMGATDLRTMQPLSHDLAGLIQCYTQGFPFMLKFLAGTLVYSGILFGVFEWLVKTNPELATTVAKYEVRSTKF